MIFRSFTFEPCQYSSKVDFEVNDYISHHESNGFKVVDKCVVGGRQGDNSLIKAVVTIVVWMDKKEDNHE